MCREYFGIITSVTANPPEDPKHFYIKYVDESNTCRAFTIPIFQTLTGCFFAPAKGKEISVTTHPNGEPAIVDVQGIMAYPIIR